MSKTSGNIILERYLRLGDRVMMNMDEEARGWGRKGVPDGTLGTVTAANTYINYRGRIYEFGRKPGMYRANAAFTVTWDNGEVDRPGAGDLKWLDESLNEIRRADREGSEKYETEIYLGPLPKTVNIYEHDIVRVVGERALESFGHDLVRVRRINWHHLNRKRNDGSPMPIFDCESVEGNSGTFYLDVTEVKLHERGNVWKWYTNKRDQIVYADLIEEVNFHSALGLREQVRCPDTGNYHWPMDSVLPGAQQGLIDIITGQQSFFGGARVMAGYKFHDRNLGERSRAKLIEGFSQ